MFSIWDSGLNFLERHALVLVYLKVNMVILLRFLLTLLFVSAVLVLNWIFIELITLIMNPYDELRLAHEHVRKAQSALVTLIEPYRSLLACCASILYVIRFAYGLPSPLPREDEDLLISFDTDLSHGMSSTKIDP